MIRPDVYSLPRQYSIVHYQYLIQEFGAPNGLCSSITESKLSRSLGIIQAGSKHLGKC